jgi:hypothetical protein
LLQGTEPATGTVGFAKKVGLMLKARLHPKWVGGSARYLYAVIYEGKLLVERSRDPEHDAARALLVMGLTGKLTLCDGKTGAPRTIIDIEKASRQRVTEESRDGLRIRQCDPDNSPHSPEDALPVAEVA